MGRAMMVAAKTCLIIDDDHDFSAFIRKVAEGIGLVTRVLTDPRQLEESLLVGNPDVVTLDMDMPHRPGLDVLSALASRQLADRVIIISGTPPTRLKDKAYVGKCNVFAILTKPARKSEIEAALVGQLARAP